MQSSNSPGRRPRRHRIAALIACSVLAIVVVSPLALAQGGRGGGRGGGFRGGFGGGFRGIWTQPEYSRRDMPLFVSNLELDASQKVIVETLLLDYLSAFEASSNAMNQSLEDLRPEPTEQEEQEREQARQQRRELFGEMREVRQTIERLQNESAQGVSPELIARLEERMNDLREQADEMRSRSFDREEREAQMEARAALETWLRQERDKLGRAFVQDVQMILTEEQLARWPDFEKLMRRMKTVRLGELSGERIDLFLVLKDADVSAEEVPDLGDVLALYADELDRALVARNEVLQTSTNEIRQAMMAGDADKAESVASRASRVRIQVRTVNDRYADTIVALLGETEAAERFRRTYRTRAFARIYRPTPMQRTFQVAREMDGLDEEILAQVILLEEAYHLDLDRTNERIVSITRREEPRRRVERFSRMMSRFRGDRGEGQRERPRDPIAEVFEERDELDDRYRQQLEAILSPEQMAALPKARSREERRQQRTGMAGRLMDADSNGDGKITKSEAPEWMQHFFDRIDSNSDGVLDEKEQQATGRGMGRGMGGGRGRE
jgi:hypothetical protein